MKIQLVTIAAITVIGLAMFGALLAERSMKSDCVQAGLHAGWDTEAIKELCK